MYSSRHLFLALILVQLFWNQVAASPKDALSSLPKKAMISPKGFDACIGPYIPNPDKEHDILDLFPCKKVKNSWSFVVAKGTVPSHGIRNIRNNKNGACMFADNDGEAITQGTPIGQLACDSSASTPKAIQFKLKFVKNKGWRIQHVESKLYLRKTKARFPERSLASFELSKNPASYWNIADRTLQQ